MKEIRLGIIGTGKISAQLADAARAAGGYTLALPCFRFIIHPLSKGFNNTSIGVCLNFKTACNLFINRLQL